MAAAGARQAPIIIDHRCTRIDLIPLSWIQKVRTECRVAYGYSLTGGQIVAGMANLELRDRRFAFDRLGGSGALAFFTEELQGDLGTPDAHRWADRTRFLLEKGWGDVNVVVWTWGDQLTRYSAEETAHYLRQMTALEERFPGVAFVYMTAPLDGSGAAGNVHRRNQQIRRFCRGHNKILYDFADIERFDPDGVDYLAKGGDFGCYYRANGSVKNWAEEWCQTHTESCIAYDCPTSKPLNCDLKARAFWWLLARTAGWNPHGDESGQPLNRETPDAPCPQ
ncbi:MAG: SGNH/GDSL hydrolase family protein [Desulfobacterales bacterium]